MYGRCYWLANLVIILTPSPFPCLLLSNGIETERWNITWLSLHCSSACLMWPKGQAAKGFLRRVFFLERVPEIWGENLFSAFHFLPWKQLLGENDAWNRDSCSASCKQAQGWKANPLRMARPGDGNRLALGLLLTNRLITWSKSHVFSSWGQT